MHTLGSRGRFTSFLAALVVGRVEEVMVRRVVLHWEVAQDLDLLAVRDRHARELLDAR